MDYLADTYFADSDYYKIDHRPVVVFYLVREWRNYASYLATLKTNMAAKGFNLYTIADVIWWTEGREVVWGWSVLGDSVDAITGYNLYDYGQPSVMDDFLYQALAKNREYRNYANSFGLRFVPGISPGFDDRSLRGGDRAIVARDAESFYRESWLNALDLADREVPIVLVASFNEWHEATELEPSAEYGVGYLDLTSNMAD